MTDRSFSYFVIALDFGRRGVEALVNPEMTRRGAIEKVREVLGDGCEISFIHQISMGELPEDVTAELIEAANAFAREDA